MATILTVASSGADFTTVQAAVDSIADNPVVDYTIRVTEAYNAQSTTLDLTLPNGNGVVLILEGHTTVRPNAFSRAEANSCARIVVSAGAAISNAFGWTIQGLAIETTATGQQAITGDFSTIKRCILIALDSFVFIQGSNCTCENSVLYSGASGWMQTNNTATLWQVSLYHAGGFGLWGNGGNFVANNCAVGGGGFGDYTGATNNDSISEDATATDYPSESGFFVDVSASWDLAATFADGDFPGADPTAFDADLATDMAGTARDATPDAGAMQPAGGGGGNPPNATYAEDSQPCEGSNGTITPTNTGDAITSSAVASGSLPTGYTLNANGTISKVGASMVVADIGSRTVYVNLTNAAGTQSNVPVPITITANPSIVTYGTGTNIIDKVCAAGAANNDPTLVSGPTPASYSSVTLPAGTTAINGTTGRIATNPTIAQWIARRGYAVTTTTTGGQTYTVNVFIEYHVEFRVTGTNAGGSDQVTIVMRVGTGSSGESGPVLGFAVQQSAVQQFAVQQRAVG